MMGRIYTAVAKAAISLALRRPSPDRIPLSAPKALENDFFTVELGEASARDQTEWFFVARQPLERGIDGLWFSEDRPMGEPGYECCLPWPQIAGFRDLSITHYYKGFVIKKRSALRFILYFYSRWYVTVRAWDQIAQAIFNRRSLARKGRLEVLHLLVDQTLDDRNYSADQFEVARLLDGTRFIRHPEHDRALNHHRMILESLAESGELRKAEYSYATTPKALSTLSLYEEQERRHKDQIRQHLVLAILTFALVVVGCVQVWLGWLTPA